MTHEHLFSVIRDTDDEPSGVVCELCDRHWPVDGDRYRDAAFDAEQEDRSAFESRMP